MREEVAEPSGTEWPDENMVDLNSSRADIIFIFQTVSMAYWLRVTLKCIGYGPNRILEGQEYGLTKTYKKVRK